MDASQETCPRKFSLELAGEPGKRSRTIVDSHWGLRIPLEGIGGKAAKRACGFLSQQHFRFLEHLAESQSDMKKAATSKDAEIMFVHWLLQSTTGWTFWSMYAALKYSINALSRLNLSSRDFHQQRKLCLHSCKHLKTLARKPNEKRLCQRVVKDIRYRRPRIQPVSTAPPGQLHHLPFILLPAGKWTIEELMETLRRQSIPFDFGTVAERFTQISKLHPSDCYVGTMNLRGYVLFAFPYTQKVVCECPEYGNAVYVIYRNWMNYIRYTKRELLNARIATRIIHTPGWSRRLKHVLRA